MISTTIIAPKTTKSKTRKTRFPTCFERSPRGHDAPQSVRVLFAEWVNQADATDNGIITINRYQAPYSHTTVDKAIAWLIAHRLLIKVQTGRGRGNSSRYFVRWSFEHKSLKERKKAVNMKNGNRGPFRRNTRYSFSHEKTPGAVSLPPQTNERAIRWGLAQVREALRDELDPTRLSWFINAAAKSLRFAVGYGNEQVRPGSQLQELIDRLIYSINWEDTSWIVWRRDVYSFVGYWVSVHALDIWLEGERRKREVAEREKRERQREEARRDPLPAAGFTRKLIEEARVSFARPGATGKDSVTNELTGYTRIKQERERIARSFEGVKSWREFLSEGSSEKPEREPKPKRRLIHRARQRVGACIQPKAEIYEGPVNIGALAGKFIEELKPEGPS